MATEFRHNVRLVGQDLDGTRSVVHALTKIKGINIRLANAIARRVNIPLEKRIGFLSETETGKIEDVLGNIGGIDVPAWLLNRRKYLETGKDIHLITSELDLQIKADIETMKASRSWRGYRHSYGLKVRGQRTKTTGRKGKVVGVRKKRVVRAVGRS